MKKIAEHQPMDGITVFEVENKIDHLTYLPDMEQIDPSIRLQVEEAFAAYDPASFTEADVRAALEADTLTPRDFGALLSPAAEPFLEEMAQRARSEKRRFFGDNVYLFTPIYLANYCENYCIYCGFNCYNNIRRKKLTFEEIEHEMKEQLLNNGIWCYEINLYFDEDLDENTLDYFAYRNDVIRKGKKSRHFYAKMKDNKTFTECYWEVD